MENTPRKIDTAIVESFNICPLCGKKEERIEEVPLFAVAVMSENTHYLCEECHHRRVEEDRRIAEAERVEKAVRLASIPEAFQKWDARCGNNDLARDIRSYSANCLWISGPNCTGKTRAAAINLLLAARAGKRCRFLRFVDLLREYALICREDFAKSERILSGLLRLDVLLLDDWGKRRITENGGELLYALIDAVYSGAYPVKLWVTANFRVSDIAGCFESRQMGDAVASRIDRMITEGRMRKLEAMR